jgi:class 3 adenylate cyclase
VALLRPALSDRYELDTVLARAPFASTVLARDLKHGRPVVLKVLLPELSAAVEGKRFLREIEIVAGLGHPHILTLIDSGTVNGLHWYVVPHTGGESLRRTLDRERQLPIKDALQIAIDVADGLDHAHRRGIVHRNITPETILFSEGHATITDFGLARVIDAAGGEQLTALGVSLGTPAYSSPEQLTGDPALDARTDIYSLGCVLHEMLTGEPPLAGLELDEMFRRRLREEPPSARYLRGTVSLHLDETVRRALARLPADRFATAAALREALREAWPGTSSATAVGDTVGNEAADGRRLAAIVCLDVAGYARLVEADEEGTLARVRRLRTELVEPEIRGHSGRVVKGLGDGFLAEFPSAVQAVACAAAIQRAMGDRDVELPEEKRIRFRIGINVGDIVSEDGDIFGDGVNVAARLERLAERGGVTLSGSAWDQVHNKLDLVFEDLGDHSVKNIARPIRVYGMRIGEEPASSVGAPAVPTSPDRTTGRRHLRELLERVLRSFGGT